MSETRRQHPAFFSLGSLLFITPLCVLGAIIGTELITRLGVNPNTALIGALCGMALGRIPLAAFRQFRSVHMQNLAQSAISAATFGAGNALLLPIGVPYLMGMPELVLPLLLGVFLAMLVDGYLLYRMFDSGAFPAKAAWPPGVAAAEAIKAGDEGGHRLVVLGAGIVVGILGNALFSIPMSAFGIAFIGNIWALTMFGVGLLVRGYSSLLFGGSAFAAIFPGGDITKAYVPQGFMIGAGLVALVQVVILILKKDDAGMGSAQAGRSAAYVRRTLSIGGVAYIVIALLLATLGGLWTQMSAGMMIGFLIYAAFAALAHEIIVGLSAMHAGWFPAFGVAVVTLLIGILFGFPPVALTVLVGFTAATGPAFADMGYDLKAGFMLRGYGEDPAFELEGRKQQLYAAMYTFVVGGILVLLSYKIYFANNLVAPIDRAYVASIKAGASIEVARDLLIWAIPGALLQYFGGPNRQMGILFGTGLLLFVPLAGWAVLVAIVIRVIWTQATDGKRQADLEVFGAGAIAGDALYSFWDTGSRYFLAKK